MRRRRRSHDNITLYLSLSLVVFLSALRFPFHLLLFVPIHSHSVRIVSRLLSRVSFCFFLHIVAHDDVGNAVFPTSMSFQWFLVNTTIFKMHTICNPITDIITTTFTLVMVYHSRCCCFLRCQTVNCLQI